MLSKNCVPALGKQETKQNKTSMSLASLLDSQPLTVNIAVIVP